MILMRAGSRYTLLLNRPTLFDRQRPRDRSRHRVVITMNRDDLAGLLMILECHDEHETLASAEQWWQRCLASLDEKPWANGRHCGDCTKQALTCMRCLIEGFQEAADALIAEDQAETWDRLYAALEILKPDQEPTRNKSNE